MIDIFLLSEILTDFQLKLLNLIQYLREQLKGAQRAAHKSGEPIITLQYSYIVAVLNCSHTSVSDGIERLCEIGLLTRISNEYGECATYQYNPNKYRSLVSEQRKRNCTLITGRIKQHRTQSVKTVLKYMTGKAITKASKPKKRKYRPSEPL